MSGTKNRWKRGAILLCMCLLSFTAVSAVARHPRVGEKGARGTIMQTPMYLISYYTSDYIASADDPSDGKFDNLPPFSIVETCRGCHSNIIAAESKNRHSNLGYHKLPEYGRGSYPERPWVQGPGKFGRWLSCNIRQLGDLKTSFSTSADFTAKVDLSAYDFVKECGVCHVGGGPSKYNPYGYTVPFSHQKHDQSDRSFQILLDILFPLASGGRRVPITPWDFSVKDGAMTWNRWYDPYGENKEAGALELDCLICHLEGYNTVARNEQIIRYEKFQNAPTVGTGIATIDPSVASSSAFDYSSSLVKRNGNNRLYLDYSFTDRITKTPPTENCAGCHMPTTLMADGTGWEKRFYSYQAVPGSVQGAANAFPARPRADLLKRGDTWSGGEVHIFMGCSGCHADTTKFQAYDPLGDKADQYMHSPGRGVDQTMSNFDGMDDTVKQCADCHALQGDLNNDGISEINIYGAPDPKSSHERAGFTMNIVPTAQRIKDSTGTVETFLGSHMDIISCTSCHVNKNYAAGRAFDFSTGAEFYTMVGSPLTTFGASNSIPLAFGWKETTPVKVLSDGKPNPQWRRQVYPFNYVTSIYWNNIGTTDANGDGFRTGDANNGTNVVADPFFKRAVADNFIFEVNAAGNRVPTGLKNSVAFGSKAAWMMENEDGGVMFTQPAEIDAYQQVVKGGNPGYLPQLSLESMPYLLMHNIGSRIYSIGRPVIDGGGNVIQYGCSECHGGAGGIFNGSYDMLGKGKNISSGETSSINITWNDLNDVQPSAFFWDRTGASRYIDFRSGNSTRDIQRWEFLGLDSAKVALLNAVTPQGYGIGIAPVAVINPIQDADPTTSGIQVNVGTTLSLSAADAQVYNGKTVGNSTYRWSFSDGYPSLTGQSVSRSFSTPGSLSILLQVTDEEGKTSQASTPVEVVTPNTITISYDNVQKSAIFAGLPQPNYKLKIYWGDGSISYPLTGDKATVVIPKTYATAGSKTIKLYVLDINGVQIGYKTQIINVL